MRLPIACALLLVVVPAAPAAGWSTTVLPGRTVGVAAWQGADVRVAMPGAAWLRHPSGTIERGGRGRTRVAFAFGGAVVGDDGTVLAAGDASVSTAAGVAVYSTGGRVAARSGSAAGWSAEIAVAGAGVGITYGAVAAAAGGGRVCAVFLRTDAAVGAPETWLACRVRGRWRSPSQLSATGHATAAAALAIDRAGRVLAVWQDVDADRLEYVVVAPSGVAPVPTALVTGGRSAALLPSGFGAFVLLYTVARPGQPTVVVRRALVRGRLGPPKRLGSGVTATAVGIGVNARGRRAFVWRASSVRGGRERLFVRAGGSTGRLTGAGIEGGQPVVNAAGDVGLPFVRQGRAGVLVYRARMRISVAHPPRKAAARSSVRLRLRISGALDSHLIRSTCGARTVARTPTAAVVVVVIPARHDLACTFRVAERGSSARTSLTIRALARTRAGAGRRRALGSGLVRAGRHGARVRAGGRARPVRRA